MTRPAPRCYDPDGYPLACSVCGKPQFCTPSGSLCVNGHGGADGVPIPRPTPAVLAARGRAARRRDDELWFYHPESDAWVRMRKSAWHPERSMDEGLLVEVGTDEERDAFEAAERKQAAPVPARVPVATEDEGRRRVDLGFGASYDLDDDSDIPF